MKKSLLLSLLPLAALTALPAQAQVEVDRAKYPDYSARAKADPSLRAVRATDRPSRVNNAETPYFPPVFNQDGGSCGSASRICYMFTYEINALRGANASLRENQYPSHFTWLLTNSNSGKDGMAIANGVPNSIVYGGTTYSAVFGNQDCSDTDFGWMQGYDKWYHAMFNRLDHNVSFPQSVKSEEGREAVKNYLWNHNGDPDFHAGGIVGIGVASGGNWQSIPKTEANDANGVTGKKYVKDWGKTVDHALTIVGYDDNIEFDLDGNGIAGEKDKDEVGAWIVVNSWGKGWCNNGFIYCPYAKAVSYLGATDFYYPEVYHIRKNYRPLRTMKILMDYTKRSELRLSAGISADLTAQAPEKTTLFEHFKYAGDGNKDGVDATTPMLGRWADGLHHEPMEFGYDLTDLSAQFDTRRPLKYFFIIESKATANGQGRVHACSVLDYEFDREGIETAFDITGEGVKIETAGNRTVISVIVAGEPLNMPLNAAYVGDEFTWAAPAESPYTLTGYNVWCNDTLCAEVGPEVTSMTMPGPGTYQVSAVYAMGQEEAQSQRTATISAYCGSKPDVNYTRNFTNSGFTIKNLFDQRLTTATIEYWIKPTTTTSWNQRMGPGWGSWMTHTTNSGQFVVGWNTTDRITTNTGALRAGQWTHVAYTVDGKLLTLYLNGKKVGSLTGGSTGIGGWGDFTVGFTDDNGINGQLDEMRVWNTARSESEIARMMYAEVDDPAAHPDLLFEMKMNESAADDLTDATGRHTIVPLAGTQTRMQAYDLFNDKRAFTADFAFTADSAYAHSAVAVQNLSSPVATRFEWSVEGEPALSTTAEHPSFVFTSPGTKTVTLTAYDTNGESISATHEVRIKALTMPEPSFIVPEHPMLANRISFVNTTATPGCRYEWTLEGGTPDKAVTTNAATRYTEGGLHTITLRATNAAGTATATREVYIYDTAPEAAFDIQPSTILKGERVKLNDASRHNPEQWAWTVENRAQRLVYNTDSLDLAFDRPGTYDVSLTVGNRTGYNTKLQKRAIVVCNADALTGLNFSGAQTVKFDNPIDAAKGFTMDYWIYAKSSTTAANNQIGGTIRNFMVRTQTDGTVVLSIGGKSYYSRSGLVNIAEWHHLAVTYDRGIAVLYVDGERSAAFDTGLGDTPLTLPAQLSMGGSMGAMNAVIDEFRIWNSPLSAEKIRAYANQPIADVAAAEAEDRLVLYYPFNQNGGNVEDVTSNGHTGTREGFGPEGDSWTKSLGAFCLSDMQPDDISADYLTNYHKPFLATDVVMNPATPQYVAIETGTEQSTWQTVGATVTGDVTTSLAVDTENDNRLTIATKHDGFAASVTNHRLFQTVTLPAGHYIFGVETDDTQTDDNSYIVAAKGNTLPETSGLKTRSLGYADLGTAETAFSLYEESRVTLGLLMNTKNNATYHYDRFYLARKLTNDDFTWTGIDTPAAGTSDISVSAEAGGIRLTGTSAAAVSVYTPAGLAVYSGRINGTKHIALPAGVYIVAGKKVMVK